VADIEHYTRCRACDGAGSVWNPDEGNGPDTLGCRACKGVGFVPVGPAPGAGDVPGYQPIPVAAAKELADRYAKDLVLVAAGDHAFGKLHFTTWGRAAADKATAAGLADELARVVADFAGRAPFEDFRSAGEAARSRADAERFRGAVERVRLWAETCAKVTRESGTGPSAEDLGRIAGGLARVLAGESLPLTD
jgi:hypothetical protein